MTDLSPADLLTIPRTCTACGTPKPLAEFTRQRGGLYGRRSWCRACCKAYAARHVESPESRERRAIYKRLWQSTERGRLLHRQATARFYRGRARTDRDRRRWERILAKAQDDLREVDRREAAAAAERNRRVEELARRAALGLPMFDEHDLRREELEEVA